MGSLPHRGVEIESHDPEQLRVLQLRQVQLGAAFQQVRRELPLRGDQLVDLLLDGSPAHELVNQDVLEGGDRKSTRLNSSHPSISYAVFCLKKKKNQSRSSYHNP